LKRNVVGFGDATATQKKKNALFMGVSRVFVVAGGGIYTGFQRKTRENKGIDFQQVTFLVFSFDFLF